MKMTFHWINWRNTTDNCATSLYSAHTCSDTLHNILCPKQSNFLRPSYTVTPSGFLQLPGHRRAPHQKLQKLVKQNNSICRIFATLRNIFLREISDDSEHQRKRDISETTHSWRTSSWSWMKDFKLNEGIEVSHFVTASYFPIRYTNWSTSNR